MYMKSMEGRTTHEFYTYAAIETVLRYINFIWQYMNSYNCKFSVSFDSQEEILIFKGPLLGPEVQLEALR